MDATPLAKDSAANVASAAATKTAEAAEAAAAAAASAAAAQALMQAHMQVGWEPFCRETLDGAVGQLRLVGNYTAEEPAHHLL